MFVVVFSGGTSSTRHTEYRDGDDGGEQTVDAGERVGPVDGHRVARAGARRGGGVRGVGVVPSPSRGVCRLGRVRGGRGVAERPSLPAVGHAHRARRDRGRDEVLPLHDRVGGRARVPRRRGEGHASSHRPRAAQRVASFHRGVREVFLLHRVHARARPRRARVGDAGHLRRAFPQAAVDVARDGRHRPEEHAPRALRAGRTALIIPGGVAECSRDAPRHERCICASGSGSSSWRFRPARV